MTKNLVKHVFSRSNGFVSYRAETADDLEEVWSIFRWKIFLPALTDIGISALLLQKIMVCIGMIGALCDLYVAMLLTIIFQSLQFIIA